MTISNASCITSAHCFQCQEIHQSNLTVRTVADSECVASCIVISVRLSAYLGYCFVNGVRVAMGISINRFLCVAVFDGNNSGINNRACVCVNGGRKI